MYRSFSGGSFSFLDSLTLVAAGAVMVVVAIWLKAVKVPWDQSAGSACLEQIGAWAVGSSVEEAA